MKSLANHANETYKGETVIAYYFNARGVALEKSVEGMLRYVLYWMAADVSSILRRDLFREAIQLLARVSEISLFIDALDENDSEDDVRDMIMFIEEMTEQAFTEGRVIHICLASRHYPVISVECSEELVLDTHHDHLSDIDAYVQSHLRLKDPVLKAKLASIIIDRASGVFLWVVLVVKVLNKEADHGRRHHLEEKLLEIPNRLSDLFDEILGRNQADRHLVTVILWMLYAKERMQPAQLYHGIMLSVGQLSATDAVLAPETFDETATIEYVLSMSRGLLEYTKYANKIGINAGARIDVPDVTKALAIAIGKNSIEIVKLFMDSGANVNIQDVGLQTFDKIVVEQESMDLEELVSLEVDSKTAKFTAATFLEIPVRHGNIEMAKLLIASGADVNMPCAGSTTALEIAVKQLDSEMLKLLLSSGADTDTSVLSYTWLLSIAVENHDSTTFDILREHKNNIDPIGSYDNAMLAVDRAWRNFLSSHTYS
ncbi:hypothetical protein MBLNU13_g10468t3 [Cladosporium sp. NU13]